MPYVQVATEGEIEPGAKMLVTVGGNEIVLARVGDEYYAVESRCPHLGGRLGQGVLEGTVLTCPLHGSQFDVTDGRMVRWTTFTGVAAKLARVFRRPRGLRTFPVKVEEGRIMVEAAAE